MIERNSRLQILLSDHERKKLEKIADQMGMKPSVFARAELLRVIAAFAQDAN